MKVRVLARLALIVVLCITGTFSGLFAQSSGQNIKAADDFFEHGRYREALKSYRDGGTEVTWSKRTKVRVGICRYEINDLEGALSIFTELDRDIKTPPEVLFYMGRIYQHRLMFDRAVNYYKMFIRESAKSDRRRDWVKDEILRCSYAMSAKYLEPLAYVENLGTSLNTFYDEFGPVPSPLYSNRLYFSSARSGSLGGLKDPMNVDDEKYGVYSTDMYFSENQNGIWRNAQSMGGELNSTRHDVIYGFSTDGQMLYYYTGEALVYGQLVIDTFGVERNGISGTDLGPFSPQTGDRDLFLFNDTIILFSSDRAGGQGGYDLYSSVKRRGIWQPAYNLGPGVNSYYDDVSPFLTKNGRHLFFSSDRLESFGGLDVFSTVFNDTTGTWGNVKNMGSPINSAGDDDHFFIGSDGLSAYFSSDRKTSFGKRDVYAAYMKKAIESHLQIRYPISFVQALPLVDESTIVANTPAATEKVMEYYIGDLAYEPNDLVLTPQNLRKLDVISNLLLIYPTIKADVICHDVSSGPASYDLYFSVKKAEQVADHLERKGIDRDRLYIKGCGAFYPRAVGPAGQPPNPSLNRLNRRIELHIYNTDGLPIDLIYEQPNIPSDVISQKAKQFSKMQPGLVFRVQIAAVGQMFQHEIFNTADDAMIIWDSDVRKYKYTLGSFKQYADALSLRDDLRTQGFGDAFIVAYVEGALVKQSDIERRSAEYPELLLLGSGN